MNRPYISGELTLIVPPTIYLRSSYPSSNVHAELRSNARLIFKSKRLQAMSFTIIRSKQISTGFSLLQVRSLADAFETQILL